MHASRKIQIDESSPFRVEKKNEPTGLCPKCGGPADIDTFWSTSSDRPGYRVLKRQICCGQRPRRFQRGPISTACPVIVEEIRVEPIAPITHLPTRDTDKPMSELESRETNANLAEGDSHNMQEFASGRVKSNRGRLPVEVRAQILELHSQDVPLEQIAEETSRSLGAVRKVVENFENPPPHHDEESDDGECDLDQVVDFLAQLPDEAMAEVLQLARLDREKKALRSSVELRLRQLRT